MCECVCFAAFGTAHIARCLLALNTLARFSESSTHQRKSYINESYLMKRTETKRQITHCLIRLVEICFVCLLDFCIRHKIQFCLFEHGYEIKKCFLYCLHIGLIKIKLSLFLPLQHILIDRLNKIFFSHHFMLFDVIFSLFLFFCISMLR